MKDGYLIQYMKKQEREELKSYTNLKKASSMTVVKTYKDFVRGVGLISCKKNQKYA